MRKNRVLVVDREAKSLRALKVSLEQAGVSVLTARDAASAIEQLESERIDLLVTVTSPGTLDGFGLLEQVRERDDWSNIGTMLILPEGARKDRVRALEIADDFICKPLFVKEFTSRVEVLLAKRVHLHLSESVADTRVQGRISDVAVVDLLRSVNTSKRDAVIQLEAYGVDGTIYLADGEVVDASHRSLRGEEAIFRMMTWVDGHFEVKFDELGEEETVELATDELIEAGIRHVAECNQLLSELPPRDAKMVVDGAELLARMNDIPEALNELIRLFNGERDLFAVLDESPFDDRSTLLTIKKLLSENLVIPMTVESPTGLLGDLNDEEEPPEVAPSSKRGRVKPRLARGAKTQVLSSVEPRPKGRGVGKVSPTDDAVDVDEEAEAREQSANVTGKFASKRQTLRPGPPSERKAAPSRKNRIEAHAADDSDAEDTGVDDAGLDDVDSGDVDSGDVDSGDVDSGDVDSGDVDSGDEGSGDEGSGDVDSGDADALGEPRELSESGVSSRFFESPPSEEDPDCDPFEEEEPVFLTAAQTARKKRNTKIVGVVVGLAAALLFLVVLKMRSASHAASDAPTPIASMAPAATTHPASSASSPVSAAVTATPSATASVAAAATAAASASAAADSGEEPPDDENLPDVEDPIKEAGRLLNIGRYKDAIPMGKAAIKKSPENGDGYFYLGTAYQSLGKHKEALDVFDRCVKQAKVGQFLVYCKQYARR